MRRHLLTRIGSGVLVLLLASMVVFVALRLVPGDPARVIAGTDAAPDTIAAVRAQLGLDHSLVYQYWHWLGNVLRLDFGTSYVIGGPIGSLIGHGVANTLVLTVTAVVVAVALSLVASIAWVVRPRRWLDTVLGTLVTVSIAVPPFVSGVLLVLVFAVLLPVLPASGIPPEGYFASLDITAQYLVLPATCLALPVAAALTRFLSEALRREWRQPYVLTARALGTPARRILTRGALRNALPTFLTVLGLQTGALLSGAVLVEAIFAWPGLGQLLTQSVGARDYPVVQALVLLSVAVFVVIQIVTDVAHAFLDPRVRLEGRP
ncbi:ABC transporter permease [Amycolatopsis thermoflava]|uniref:ABC transporter permease n=1 Tax=Amycolatopsis thermoflava TaxID=84480 RepID=UPI00040611E3|nr:ABC transporter permease [Amycolatopsis thermoflava]